MEKWEYLFAFAVPYKMEGKGLVVVEENSKPLAKKGRLGGISREDCPALYEYCNNKGQEGWEMVSITEALPTEGIALVVAFKRKIVE